MRHLASLLLVLGLAVTTPLHADALADLRGALGKLPAREPVRATYEIQLTVKNDGKFDDAKYTSKAAVDIESDGDGVRLVYPRALLDQIAKEMEARARDPKVSAPTLDAVGQVGPIVAADTLNAVPPLLNMLVDSKVVEDRTGTLQGKPARVVIFRLADKKVSDVGKVTFLENKLTLWLGPDHVPLAAEMIRDLKYSILVIRGTQKTKRSWYFAQVGDRLVRTRTENSEITSGMGQHGNESSVTTLKVHS